MSDSSSSPSSSSVRVTKLTAAGKVPAWYFMDIPTGNEGTEDRREAQRRQDRGEGGATEREGLRAAEFPELAEPSNMRQQQVGMTAAEGAATPLAKKLAKNQVGVTLFSCLRIL